MTYARPRSIFGSRLALTFLAFGLIRTAHSAAAQAANSAQQLDFAALRSAAGQGQFNTVKADSAGNLFLLLDQKDGVRVLKLDSSATTVLAQTLLGAAGDVGTALTLDPAGNVFVTGTTTSSAFASTSSAAIPNRTGSSTNSFVARFDSSLNPVFVSFTGGSRTAASAIAATADSVFVTGITYGSDLPVTASAIQQTPATGSTQSGFVEKFSSSGSTLLYATYLTGANGDTTPTSIAADASGDAFVGGSTSATGFPTVAALIPAMVSTPSGFLTRISPAGDSITASTYIPGPGISSVALDAAGTSLLVSGSVALGQFPVTDAAAPLAQTPYQVLLRLPLDLATVTSGTVLAPGTQSYVAAAPGGAAWVDGALSFPALPLAPLATLGSGFALRVTASNSIDQTARFGGLPVANASYAGLPITLESIAVDPIGKALVAGVIQPTLSTDLLASERYDLPLRNAPTAALPSTLRSTIPAAAACTSSQCTGSAAYLARLSPVSGAALAFSADATPFLTLRNLGTASADTLQLTASSGSFTSNCTVSLAAGKECSILLSGGSAGTLTATSSDAATQTVPYPAFSATPPAAKLVFSPRELDFGIQTSTSVPATRTITITNLGTAAQTFTSQLDAYSSTKITPTSLFSESAGDCALSGAQTTKLLGPGGVCHITIAFTPSSSSSADGIQQAQWLIGAQDLLLTGYSQAASLSASASQVDFGTQYSGGIHLPRYLFVSNSSGSAIPHATVTVPSGCPFSVVDACPATLQPGSICRLRLDYLASTSTSTDSTTLTLDSGISVLVTGKTLPAPGGSGTTVSPTLAVNPATVTFPDAVVVTGVSSSTQAVSVSNTGTASTPVAISISGDFSFVSSCGATLAAGQTCAVAITFAPTQSGTRTGLLSVSAGTATTPVYVALTGTATPILSIANGAIDFGATPVGQPVTQFFKLAQPFTALIASTTGPYSLALVEDTGFGHGQPPASAFSTSLTAACHNCYLALRFQPTLPAAQPGTLVLASSSSGSPVTFSLTGTGLPLHGLLLTPVAQNFGSVPLHSRSGSTIFTLTNLASSGASVNVTPQLLGSDFALTTDATGATPCGGPLAYSASCTTAVAFAPAALGARTGSLLFTAGELSASAALSGNAVPDPGLAITPLSLTFVNAPGAASLTQAVTLTNTSSASLQIGTPSVSSPAFTASTSCSTLAPSASCTIALTFLPGAATVQATLSFTATSPGSTPPATYTVSLSGSYTSAGASLQLLPNSSQFAPATVGTESEPRLLTLNNLTGKPAAVSISLPRQFVLVGSPCTTIAANGSCTFSVAFLPLNSGDIPGTITATATPTDGSAAFSTLAYLEGYASGSGTLTLGGALIANNIFNFGQVAPGQTLAQVFTLNNAQPAGSPAITIRRVTSAPPFLASTTCLAALAPGQSCSVTVTYTPLAQTGVASSSDAGQLIVESDAASSPTILNLSGSPGPGGSAGTAPLATYTLSQGSLTFPITLVGNVSPPQTVTIANTGTVALHLASLSVTPDFTVQNTCTTILPGASCSFSVTSTPQTTGIHIAALEIATDSATTLDFISLLSTATPATLSVTPSALDFGSVQVGSSAVLAVTVTNSGSSPVTFNGLTATTDYSAGGSCPPTGGTLAGGAACTIQVTYKPTLAGSRPGTLSIATSATTLPLTVALAGIGTQSRLVLTPSALAFGSISVGASSNLSVSLRNSGTAAVTGLAFSISGDYALTIPCGVTTLAPGDTCTAQVTFTPVSPGARPGTLTITSSDPSSPAAIPLTGTGVAAAGSFTLTVDGGSTSTVSVASGTPATYNLTITPTGGFTGTVVLTCIPITAAQYASCSLAPGSVPLGSAPQAAVVTINTITSAALAPSIFSRRTLAPLACLAFPGMLLLGRRLRAARRRLPLLFALSFAASLALLGIGCGGGSPASNLRYAPTGSYQYQVTAVSTGGVQTTQTVTLNLIVGPH